MRYLAKIATMLTVYLAWICGTAHIALSCHANREAHAHCCASCKCHHNDCDKSHFEDPHACNHDHSNTITLYDTAKQNSLNIEPVALYIITQLSDNTHAVEITKLHSLHHLERSVTITLAPTLSRRGMRAPPAIA